MGLIKSNKPLVGNAADKKLASAVSGFSETKLYHKKTESNIKCYDFNPNFTFT